MAALAAQHAELGARAAALGAQVASAAAVADLQARLDDLDAQVAAGGACPAVMLLVAAWLGCPPAFAHIISMAPSCSEESRSSSRFACV